MTFPNDCRITSDHQTIYVTSGLTGLTHRFEDRLRPYFQLAGSLGSLLYRLIPETIGGVFDKHQSLWYARTAMTQLISLGALNFRFRLYLPDRRLLKLLFYWNRAHPS
jgi:hypothetical protein